MEGLFYVAASLLAISGVAKLADPAPTSGALAAAGVPSAAWAVRVLAMTELAVAVAGLAVAGVGGGLAVAALYAAFAGFALIALARRLPIRSCGCLGREDTPPDVLHVVATVAASASGVWVAMTDGPSLAEVLTEQPVWGVPYVVLLGVGVYATYLVLSELPRLRRLVSGL